MVGHYDVTRVVNTDHEIVKELECSICLCIFDNPIKINECGHTFCYKCIEGLVHKLLPAKAAKCPVCSTKIKPTTKRRINDNSVRIKHYEKTYVLFKDFMTNGIVSKLKIKCDYEPHGCQHISELGLMATHLKVCPQRHCKSCQLVITSGSIHNCEQSLKKELKTTKKRLNDKKIIIKRLEKENEELKKRLTENDQWNSAIVPNPLEKDKERLEKMVKQYKVKYDNKNKEYESSKKIHHLRMLKINDLTKRLANSEKEHKKYYDLWKLSKEKTNQTPGRSGQEATKKVTELEKKVSNLQKECNILRKGHIKMTAQVEFIKFCDLQCSAQTIELKPNRITLVGVTTDANTTLRDLEIAYSELKVFQYCLKSDLLVIYLEPENSSKGIQWFFKPFTFGSIKASLLIKLRPNHCKCFERAINKWTEVRNSEHFGEIDTERGRQLLSVRSSSPSDISIVYESQGRS